MPITNFEKYLDVLKKNHDTLSYAYRRGYFEAEIEFSEDERFLLKALEKLPIQFRRREKTLNFKNAAERLFDIAQLLHKEYPIEKLSVSNELKEQLAEYQIRAQALSYEISDYFLSAGEEISEHFRNLAKEVCKSPLGYYKRHYRFVVTPQSKENIIKQIVLSALCGVNVIYRQYNAKKYSVGIDYTDILIEFLQKDFLSLRERKNTAFGLLGLAYFLKGRLLLGRTSYIEADQCFRLSAEYYINSLSTKDGILERNKEKREEKKGVLPETITEQIFENRNSVEVPLSELLAMRRAALALALGSGYICVISSRVKEARNLLVLARGILHLNSQKVYSYYTELLFWSAKRAAHSHDITVLAEAKERIIKCREVFNEQVRDSHYPHRASIELSLVLHYLAQLEPARRSEYYRDAIADLKDAIDFATVKNRRNKTHTQLHAEASYILSHIYRYRTADMLSENAAKSVEDLKTAFNYASEAEIAAEDFPRHKCEALLALCGVYADVAEGGIELSEINPKSKPGADPHLMLKSKALEALRENQNSNPRIDAICYLHLIEHYLRNPNTLSRAYHYWEEWLKIQDSIEHAYVKEWAERTKAELDRTKKRYHVVDFEGDTGIAQLSDIDKLTNKLKASFAKNKIAQWVEQTHNQYQLERRGDSIKIVKIKTNKKPGRYALLQAGLESFLGELLTLTNREAKELIEDQSLLKFAEDLMKSYLEEK